MQIQWNPLKVNTFGPQKSVDFIHFQEISPKIHGIKTGCLPFFTYDSGLRLQYLYFVTQGYIVLNLGLTYISYLGKEKTTLSLKIN